MKSELFVPVDVYTILCRSSNRVGNEKKGEMVANGVDRAHAGSRYRKELHFGHTALSVSVAFFFRDDSRGITLKVILLILYHATHCRTARTILIIKNSV